MILAAIRDLQWRRRRLAIVVIVTGLVLALSVVMSGLSNAFRSEVDRTLDRQGADVWVAKAGADGPFSSGLGLVADDVAAVLAAPGVEQAAPLLYLPITFRHDGTVIDAGVFGVVAGDLDGLPADVAAPGPREVVVPRSVGADVGDVLTLSNVEFTVSGVVDRASLYAGSPTLFVDIEEARSVFLNGLPATSLVLVRGDPTLPPTLEAFDRGQTEIDLTRPLEGATASIDLMKFMLWAVAALVVGSVIFVSVLERTRDIAIFKATGSSNAAIGVGVCVQSVIITGIAAVLGSATALIMAPRFQMDVEIPVSAWFTLPIVALCIGLVSGMFGLRRVAAVEPASAFAGA
jgi:putative ABC transport system permease protein